MNEYIKYVSMEMQMKLSYRPKSKIHIISCRAFHLIHYFRPLTKKLHLSVRLKSEIHISCRAFHWIHYFRPPTKKLNLRHPCILF